MKTKATLVFSMLLIASLLTSPLRADENIPPPITTEPSTEVTTSPYTEPTPPKTSSIEKNKKTAAVIIATLASITIGLLVSGADTGKHAEVRKRP